MHGWQGMPVHTLPIVTHGEGPKSDIVSDADLARLVITPDEAMREAIATVFPPLRFGDADDDYVIHVWDPDPEHPQPTLSNAFGPWACMAEQTRGSLPPG